MDSEAGIFRLVWDDWNREHIWTHRVVPNEVEEVIAGRLVVRETYKNRRQLIGRTLSGRLLSVVIGPVPGQTGVWYVFSARSATRKAGRAFETPDWE